MKPTPEMIEVACKAHTPQFDRMDPDLQVYARQQMEAALSAALSDQPAAPVVGEPGPIQHVRAHAHLIRCFADGMTDRNWADKALYIKQQAERIMSEIDAAPSAPEGWQSIETAPRDGTKILAWSGFWDKHHLVRWNQGENAWCEGSWCFGSVPDMVWMPLPTPPALGGSHE